MAMGRRKWEEQGTLWIATSELPQSGGHPFCQQVNKILKAEGFDRFVEKQCRRFYAGQVGRPSLPPAVYFRMLLIGYFEGIDRERGIAWRAADSLGLRRFLGYGWTNPSADRRDTTSTEKTVEQTDVNRVAVMEDGKACKELREQVLREVVTDKGYHRHAVLRDQREREIRTYLSELKRGRRN